MPIEIIPGALAHRNLQRNALGRWPARGKPNRLYPIASPVASAKFRISAADDFFCVGSCFAREVERTLANQLGYKVTSLPADLPRAAQRANKDGQMVNKYNVYSILNELRWALDPAAPYDPERFLTRSSEGVADYQLKGSRYLDDEAGARTFREAYNAMFANVKQADVVVITLGLSEAWFDEATSLYLNAAPSPALIEEHPRRFALHVLDFAQTETALDAIYGLLMHYLKPSFRLLITVSPVPLLSTFRDQDVLLANTYSKAVLRAAVEGFALNKRNVCYFPSYEQVALSDPEAAWVERDFRHVDRVLIRRIMKSLLDQLGPPMPASAEPDRAPAS